MSDVLVVDSNQSIRKMYMAGLGGFGFRVAEAASPLDARKLLSTGEVSPSVIITDVSRNEPSGMEFIEFLHNDPAYQHIKVIVTTADSYIAEKKDELYADVVMVKPIDLSRLVKVVYLYRRPENSTT